MNNLFFICAPYQPLGMHTTAHLTSLSFQASPASNDHIPSLWMEGCQSSSFVVQPWEIPHPALYLLLMLHCGVAERVSPYFLSFLWCHFQICNYLLCRLEKKVTPFLHVTLQSSSLLPQHCTVIETYHHYHDGVVLWETQHLTGPCC